MSPTAYSLKTNVLSLRFPTAANLRQTRHLPASPPVEIFAKVDFCFLPNLSKFFLFIYLFFLSDICIWDSLLRISFIINLFSWILGKEIIDDYTPAQTCVGLSGKSFKDRFANLKSSFKDLSKNFRPDILQLANSH